MIFANPFLFYSQSSSLCRVPLSYFLTNVLDSLLNISSHSIIKISSSLLYFLYIHLCYPMNKLHKFLIVSFCLIDSQSFSYSHSCFVTWTGGELYQIAFRFLFPRCFREVTNTLYQFIVLVVLILCR